MQQTIGSGNNRYVIAEVEIKSGSSSTDIIQTDGMAIIGIETPAEWTDSDIALLSGSSRDSMKPVVDSSGSRIKSSASVDKFISIPFSDACWGPFIQINTIDDAGDDVQQEASRTLLLHMKPYLN